MALPSRRVAASAALLLLLLLATELGTTTVVEARTCISQSHSFKGACLSSTNCASVCMTEGFPGGDCKTRRFQRKCFCVKNC
ncbi:defensin-like protein CAL1 isoform X2 [Lolium perenne]|uniref:defensin-like protein CAL1 isoform X2 n=1 Tax=Lolium perenne TaxID=4522 RepID=UPI0021EB461E|nr:defensin-like protein CAL1 isoform X2 [Lolium perenne]